MTGALAIFDLWPWNMPAGPTFLITYAVITLSVLALLWGAMILLGHRVDGGRGVGVVGGGGGGGAQINASTASGLQIGVMPKGRDVWTIAYMNGGAEGLGAALIAAAVAGGWLSWVDGGVEVAVSRPADPTLRALNDRLQGCRTDYTLRSSVLEFAKEMALEADADLELAGLQRTSAQRWPMMMLALAAAGGLITVSVLRVIVRSIVSEGQAPFPLYLLGATVAACAGCWFLYTKTRRSSHWSPYVSWLSDVSTLLRSDVKSGRRASPADVALAAAIGGTAVIGAMASMAMFATALPTYTPPSTGDSSSSCGGGGGCGGGCGGGGGCS
jgi:hypothetical protein